MPRQVLVVFQFTVSITLIIGTLLVYRQIQFAQNRPIGYDRGGLLSIRTHTADLIRNYELIRNELLQTGVVSSMAESSMPTTGVFSSDYRLEWESYYLMNDWLQKYEYRTNISWWIFASSGIGALFITLLTVSFQSIRAALLNPVHTFHSE
jgi:hypothetical protein